MLISWCIGRMGSFRRVQFWLGWQSVPPLTVSALLLLWGRFNAPFRGENVDFEVPVELGKLEIVLEPGRGNGGKHYKLFGKGVGFFCMKARHPFVMRFSGGGLSVAGCAVERAEVGTLSYIRIHLPVDSSKGLILEYGTKGCSDEL